MVQYSWIIYALVALIFFSGMILLFRYATDAGMHPSVVLFIVALTSALFYAGHSFITKQSMQIGSKLIMVLVLAGVLSYVANLFYTKAIALAPNPGYAVAITSLQIALIALASVVLFNTPITAKKGAGIVLALVAIVLLAL